jgi:hypothetical protein
MLKRLFEPMECDRACRVRVYVSWGVLVGLLVLVAYLSPLAKAIAGIQIDARRTGTLLFASLLLGSGSMLLVLCRTYAAYYVWRQLKPSPVGKVMQSLTPSFARETPLTHRQMLVRNLMAGVVTMSWG